MNLLRDYSPISTVRSFIFLTQWPRANLLIDDGMPTNDPEAEVEEGRERHEHLREAKVDKDRMGLEVGFELFSSDRTLFSLHRHKKSRNDPESEGKSSLTEGDAKEVKVVPEEGPPDLLTVGGASLAFLVCFLDTNLLIDNGPPANDPKDVVEEVREHPAPSKSVKEAKELGVGLTFFPSGRVFFSLHHEPGGLRI